MARITYTPRETARLLGLPDARESLDALVTSGTLRVAAITPDGRQLYDADDVRRAAGELALATRRAGRPRTRSA
jgi:hypothetical protein